MKTLNDFLEALNLIDSFFVVTDENGKIINMSKEVLAENLKGTTDTIVQIKHKYYEINEKIIIIEGKQYFIKIFNDITKYYNKIVNLEKKVEDLKKDKLTTLPNRHEIDSQIERVKKANNKRIFVMCDIDNFKSINDTYGHPIGDLVLKTIGVNLRENVRGEDFASRFGGEEFFLIFNTDDVDSIVKRLNQIRINISDSLNLIKNDLINVTFSAGIAIFNENDLAEETIRKADEALYYIKNNGKNGDAIYDEKEKKPIMIKKQKYSK